MPRGSTEKTTPVWRIILAIPLILLLLYLMFDFHFGFNNDVIMSTYMKMAIIQKEMLSGQLPLWNPYGGFGTVLIFGGAKAVLENLALFFLPVHDTIVLSGILHILLGLTTFYMFAREIDLSERAALLGAVIWVFNGYSTWHLHMLNFSGTSLILPFLLFCYLRYSRRGGQVVWMLLASLALAYQSLYGRPSDLVYGLVLVFFFCLYDTLVRSRESGSAFRWLPEVGRTLGFLAGMVILGVLLSAFFVLPFSEHLLESARVRDPYFAGWGAVYIKAQSLPEFLLPGLANRIWMSKNVIPLPTFLNDGLELGSWGYFGLAALPFLMLSWRSTARFRSFFLCVAAVVPPLFFHFYLFDLLRRIPLHGGALMSVRVMPLFMLAIAVLVGMGYDRLFMPEGQGRGAADGGAKSPGRVCFPVLLGLGIFVLALLVKINVGTNYYWALVFIVGLSLVAILLTFLATEGRVSDGVSFYVLVATLLATSFIVNHSDRSDWNQQKKERQQLQEQPQMPVVKYFQDKKREPLFRVAAVPFGRYLFHPTYWEQFFVPSASFQIDTPSVRLLKYFRVLIGDYTYEAFPILDNLESPFYDLANVRYFVMPHSLAQRLPADVYPKVFYDPKKRVSVLKNTRAFPRLYFVSGFVVMEDDEEALKFMATKGKEEMDWFRANVLLAEAPPGGFSPGDSSGAKVLSVDYKETRVALTVKTPEPTLLVFSDAYDEGWHVSIDGRPGEIIRANYLFRAVLLPAGVHRLRFWYLPSSFVLGFFISAATFVFVLTLLGTIVFRKREELRR